MFCASMALCLTLLLTGGRAFAQADTTPGQFCCPHGATWDSHGNIYVAEWLPYGRVTKLRRLA